MSVSVRTEMDLLQRLPLPLAHLYRRAQNAKTPLDRHLMSMALWEATLKLLGSTAVVRFAHTGQPDEKLAGRIQKLSRPGLGDWWALLRDLVPVLVHGGDASYRPIAELLFGGRRHDDLPRLAALDVALVEILEGKKETRVTVQVDRLFDRLVQHRNQLSGHGSPAAWPDKRHDQHAQAVLTGMAELLVRLDVLAGQRLVHVAEVRQVGGTWLVQRYDLMGESPRRLPALEFGPDKAPRLPDGDRVYLDDPVRAGDPAAFTSLHPLLFFDADAAVVFFLNSRWGKEGKRRTEYLCYTSGAVIVRPDLGTAQCKLLGRLLGMPVGPGQAEDWGLQADREEPAPAPVAEAPRTLGEYELHGELGRGGMGIVYRAWQPSLRRHVALKRLKQQPDDDRALDRFRREIRALGKVDHPHLVKVIGAGSDGEDFYYTMELVEGTPLSDLGDAEADAANAECEVRNAESSDMKATEPARSAAPFHNPQSAIRIRTLAELLRQIASAAHALHEAGVLHRDIKPGNIQVTADGSKAVLMDLGLAQLADDLEGRLTRTRQFVGTLRYASPQQVLAVGELDRRTDIYSLGATMWEVLAQAPLFGAGDQTPTPVLMEQIQRQEPARLRSINRAVPRDLEAIVHKCLEKDTGRRYPTAQDLADDLGRWLEGKPVRARPVRNWERGWKWAKRRPVVAALTSAVVLAVVAGLIASFYLTGWALRERDRADDKADKAQKAEEQAQEKARKEEEARKNRERLLYTVHMRQAQRDWDAGNLQLVAAHLAACPTEFRNWEHRYLQRLLQGGYASFPWTGGEKGVDLHFSADGQRLSVLDQNDHRAAVRDVVSGRELFACENVSCLSFNADGSQLAGGMSDHTIIVWDSVSGKELHRLRGHTEEIHELVFRADGRQLASSGEDKVVKLWDLDTEKPTDILQSKSFGFKGLTFSPDGKRLAAGTWAEVRVWDAADKNLPLILKSPQVEITRVTFSPDGARVIGSYPGWPTQTWCVWDLKADPATRQRPILEIMDAARGALSPDCERLATCDEDSRFIKVYDTRTGNEEPLRIRAERKVFSCGFSPDGRLVTAVAEGLFGNVFLGWSATSGEQLFKTDVHAGMSVLFSPDGQRIFHAGADFQKYFCEDWSTGQKPTVLFTLNIGDWTREELVFSPDGRRLAVATEDKMIRLWDVTGPQDRRRGYFGAQVESRCLAFSPDSQLLACSLADTLQLFVHVLNPGTGQELVLDDGQDVPNQPLMAQKSIDVAFSGDGREVVTTSGTAWDLKAAKKIRAADLPESRPLAVAYPAPGQVMAALRDKENTLVLWDLLEKKEIVSLREYGDDFLFRAAFSPGARRLAIFVEGHNPPKNRIEVWDVAERRLLHALTDQPEVESVRLRVALAFSADGHMLATAANSHAIQLWDVESGELLRTLPGHANDVACLSFSPDGQRLATGARDGMVKVWDPESGEELLALVGGTDTTITAVAFSPDGRRLAAGDDGGNLYVWDAERPGDEIEQSGRVWQEREAEAAERDRAWFAAAFHLGWLIRRDPHDTDLLVRRGNALGEQNLWKAAAADFDKAARLRPALSTAWFCQGLLALAEGDLARYRDICREALDRFGTTSDAADADTITLLCTLAPDAVKDMPAVVRLARVAVDADPENAFRLTTLGAALYRAGKHTDALEQLQAADKLTQDANGTIVLMHYFLALTHQSLKHADEARLAREHALELMTSIERRAPWTSRVSCDLLRREAQAAIKD